MTQVLTGEIDNTEQELIERAVEDLHRSYKEALYTRFVEIKPLTAFQESLLDHPPHCEEDPIGRAAQVN